MNVFARAAALPIDHAYTPRDYPDLSHRCVCGALQSRHPNAEPCVSCDYVACVCPEREGSADGMPSASFDAPGLSVFE